MKESKINKSYFCILCACNIIKTVEEGAYFSMKKSFHLETTKLGLVTTKRFMDCHHCGGITLQWLEICVKSLIKSFCPNIKPSQTVRFINYVTSQLLRN